METAVPQSDDVRLEHAVAGTIEDVSLWLRGDTNGIAFALSDPALELISLCLRQGLPGGTFAACPRSTSSIPYLILRSPVRAVPQADRTRLVEGQGGAVR